jgi:Ca2+-binding EF-hand superfamily protein
MGNAGKTATQEEIQAMITEVDLAKDGRISFEEFEKLMIPEEVGMIKSL